MFTQLIFTILILLLLSNAPQNPGSFSHSLTSFGFGMLIYAFFLGLLYLQTKWLERRWRQHPERYTLVVNIEIALFFMAFYYALKAHLLFFSQFQNLGYLLSITFGLLMYLAAIYISQYHSQAKSRTKHASAWQSMLTLLPFTIPFLLFSIFAVALEQIPFNAILKAAGLSLSASAINILMLVIAVIFIALLMVLLPAFFVKIWQCHPLTDPVLLARLKNLCQRAHFKCAGFKTWGVMERYATAAIIGLTKRFRYVLFTPPLLRMLNVDQIECVVAHEIGHSHFKHLLVYPLVLSGMILFASLFNIFVNDTLGYLWMQLVGIPLNENVVQILQLIPSALFIIVYFYYVFAYFSRICERQADSYIFALGLPAEAMVEALYSINSITGRSPTVPNRFYYSIQERINFLLNAQKHPSLLAQHTQKVQRTIMAFSVLWLLAIFMLATWAL